MTIREKTPEEVAEEILKKEEMYSGNVVNYKVDVEKIKQFSYEAIASKLNELFGPIVIDAGDEGIAEMMLLDGPLGDFLSRDDEKEDIL